MSDDARSGEHPVRRVDDRSFVIDLSDGERAMIVRLVGELRELLDAEDCDANDALLERLFPPASTGDDEANDEYQRLMRSELLQSKLAAAQRIESVLSGDGACETDETGLVAFLQSLNSVRLVLGTMLQVSDDPDAPEVMPGFEHSKEYHLYGYLSWLLEWTVAALET